MSSCRGLEYGLRLNATDLWMPVETASRELYFRRRCWWARQLIKVSLCLKLSPLLLTRCVVECPDTGHGIGGRRVPRLASRDCTLTTVSISRKCRICSTVFSHYPIEQGEVLRQFNKLKKWAGGVNETQDRVGALMHDIEPSLLSEISHSARSPVRADNFIFI